jgi:hypothetical protein
MTENKTSLIIVVTRAYATKGGSIDEFVKDWEFADEELFRWEKVEASEGSAYVLILHGCDETKGNLPEIFHKAIQEKRSLPSEVSKAWFCHHGMKNGNRQGLEKKIRYTFTDLNSDNFKSISYSSLGGGLAVDNLLKKLSEEDEYLVKALNAILKGRLIFVHRLHALQSCLLRLQFCIAILYLDGEKGTEKEYKQEAIEEAQKIAKEIGKIIGFEGFSKYFQEIEKLTTGRDDIHDDIQAAVELVRVLSGAGDEKKRLAAQKFWNIYTEKGSYSRLPQHHKLPVLEDDFRLFARALDCLVDATNLVVET